MRKSKLIVVLLVAALTITSFLLPALARIKGEKIHYSWQGSEAEFEFGGQGYFSLEVATDDWSHSLQVSAESFEGSFEGDSSQFKETLSFKNGKSLSTLESLGLEVESFHAGDWSIERLVEDLMEETDQLEIGIKLENGWLLLNGLKGGKLTKEKKTVKTWRRLSSRVGFDYTEAKRVANEFSDKKIEWALNNAHNPPQFWREIHGYKGISVVGRGRVFLKLFWPTPKDKIGKEVKDTHVNISITEEREDGRENLIYVQRMKYDPGRPFPISKPQFQQEGTYVFDLSDLVEPGEYNVYLDFFEGNPGEASQKIEIDKTNF